MIPFYATHFFACSTEAAKWLFGKKIFIKKLFYFIPNSIELAKFSFDYSNRINLRTKLRISIDDFVIGHVGRFDYQKNHRFIFSFFSALIKNKPHTKLILIGEGNDKAYFNDWVIRKSLQNNVIFVNNTDNIHQYYSVFDLFVLPSKFEGLGIVLLEAQANGLNCLVSPFIPKEVNFSGNVNFLNLSKKIWSVKINKLIEEKNFSILTRNQAVNINNVFNFSNDLGMKDLYCKIYDQIKEK